MASRSIKIALMILFVAFCVGSGVALGFVRQAIRDVSALGNPEPALSSAILDCDGNVITRVHGVENRVSVDIDDLPEHLLQAVVAIEDDRFYSHPGFDVKAILRAAYVNLLEKDRSQGGSTITQQLARNAILKDFKKTYARKMQELILAMQLERSYTKREILEMYLNQVPFGSTAYGVEAASQLYFGKSAKEVNLAEAALLAGLIQRPSAYSPHANFEAAKARQAVVIDKMVSLGIISEGQGEDAKAQQIVIKPPPASQAADSDFLDYVLEVLLDKFGPDLVYGGGLTVHTTLDPKIQEAAEEAVKKVLDPVFPLGDGAVQPDAAVVVMDPQTGHLKALVGGRERGGRLEFNNAVHAVRQPGSAFKPVAVYAAAFDGGLSPGTVFDDAPVVYPAPPGGQAYAPENYDRTFRGLVTLREAIERSLNVVAVKVFDEVGIERGIEYAKKLGITNLVTDPGLPRNDLHLPTALGGISKGVTPLEMAVAYATFANGGVRVEPTAITKVVDKNGVSLWEYAPKKTVVLSPEAAYLMNNVLKGVLTRGTGTGAAIGRPAAGKTGTTNDYADAWFCGYTPNMVGIVWMGYAQDRRPMPGNVVGGTYPANIWKLVMKEATEDLRPLDFPAPAGMVAVEICAKSGRLPCQYCPPDSVRLEIFAEGTEPVETCEVHVPLEVCAESGDLAGPFCPDVETRVFLLRPYPLVPASGGRLPADAHLQPPEDLCSLHRFRGRRDEDDDEEEEDEGPFNRRRRTDRS